MITYLLLVDCIQAHWPSIRVLFPHRLGCSWAGNLWCSREFDWTWLEFEYCSNWGSAFIWERRESREVLKVDFGRPVILRTSLGSLLNSLAPWNGRELKRRLENLVFLSGLVCMVLPRRELISDWVLIRLVLLDWMFGTWPYRIAQM